MANDPDRQNTPTAVTMAATHERPRAAADVAFAPAEQNGQQ